MKKFCLFFLVIALFYTSGCAKTIQSPVSQSSPVKISDDSSENSSPVDFCVQYIRSNGYQEGAKFPQVQIVDRKEKLDSYYATYREVYDLERKQNVYSDTTIGFLDACDKYDEAFFQQYYLIFVLLEEGSGSFRHNVKSVDKTADNELCIRIDSILPGGIGTCDMAEWHIILELKREALVESPGNITVYWNDTLAFNGSPVESPYTEPEVIFQSPPKGCVITPLEEVKITPAGHSWTYKTDDAEFTSIIADQARRPVDQDSLPKATLDSRYLETVYAPIPGNTAYAPTNALGCLLKADFEVQPTEFAVTCWPDTVWQDSNVPEEAVIVYDNFAFYAKPGCNVYEIVAKWEEGNNAYWGTVNYYICINVEVAS